LALLLKVYPYHVNIAEDWKAAFCAGRAAFAPLEESKVVSSQPRMFNSRKLVRAYFLALLVAVFSAASAGRAQGQSFTLMAISQLNPVNPGGSSTANLSLQGSGGFNSAVSFSSTPCTVTPVQTSDTPVCSVTPSSANPGTGGAQVSVIVTTSTNTPAGSYQITVTGVSGAITQTVQLILGVSTLTEDYTLSVSPTTATPSPVTAGNTATTTVTISPIGSYSGHTITLACSSVTPVTEPVPICSFNPTQVSITAGTPPTAILSIITIGPNPVSRNWNRRIFYALWLLAPGLGLLGWVSTGSRRKQFLGLLLLVGLSGGLLLVPACGSSNTVGNTTPNSTYTFTLSAVDETGNAPSNGTTDAATVTVAVN
jgi:hypothetical protein